MFISLFSSPSIQMCKERLTSNHSSFNLLAELNSPTNMLKKLHISLVFSNLVV
ncbi:hypothetical protein FHS60_001443 [Alloprevotella rava]|uniref:Uncharacterized protein n=1 Tax=Alloprevotella rava TaxID=671218 RepID=A0A7W5Y1S0_9BACT|nr:hypothetical protein [Alloprevotella rava]